MFNCLQTLIKEISIKQRLSFLFQALVELSKLPVTLFKTYMGWSIWRLIFEPTVISNAAILMSFYSTTKFRILSPLNLINRFKFEQCWNLLAWAKAKLHHDVDLAKKFIFSCEHHFHSKITVFGFQKTHTWSYRTQRKHYK